MTAYFVGTRDTDGRRKVTGQVSRVEFSFGGDRRTYVFRPRGENHYDGWNHDIFSPDGRYVLLLQDHFGPFHLVETRRLRAYLSGKERPVVEVWARVKTEGRDVPAKGHHLESWQSPTVFRFSGGCCGTTHHYRFDVAARRTTLLRRGH